MFAGPYVCLRLKAIAALYLFIYVFIVLYHISVIQAKNRSEKRLIRKEKQRQEIKIFSSGK